MDVEDPPTITAYALVDGGYEVIAEVHGELRVTTPVEAVIQVDRLTSRR